MKRFASLLTVVAGLAISSNASAAQIIQTFTQPLTPTVWEVADIPFNQFNPSLGTLTSVTLAFNGEWRQAINMILPPTSPSQSITSFSSLAFLNIYGSANFVNDIANLAESQTSGPYNIFPGGGAANTVTGNFTYGPTAQLPLSNFLGLGTISFSMSSQGDFSSVGGSDVQISVVTRSGGTLTLVYNYDVATPPVTGVPEPTTMAGAVAGLLALVPMARRRLAKTA